MGAIESLRELELRHASSGVEPPATSEQRMFWAGTCVAVAGVSLLVGEGELEEIIETPAVTPIPGTKPWVMGVAAHKGGLLPVFSGDVLFRGRPYAGRVRDYCMVVRRPGMYFALTLSGVKRNLRLPIENRDMHHPIDTDFGKFTLGGFHHRGEFLPVLDMDKLVSDEGVANASTANSSNRGNSDE